MRRVLCAAMGEGDDKRPDGVRLLVVGSGKWTPEAVRVKSMVKNWKVEVRGYEVPECYWDFLRDYS